MAENNDKKKIWIYAIVLFTSAFVVLLLTAISQIKLNNNINNYKTQINVKEKEKSDFQLNLSSSQNTNKKLREKMNKIKSDLDKEILNRKEQDKKYNELNLKMNKTIEVYEKIISADTAYGNNDFINCAIILAKQIDISYLSSTAKARYMYLKENSFSKASRQLYLKGISEYKSGNYDSAVIDFQLSVDISSNEYYSDDCYYFMTYAFYRNGKEDIALKTAGILLNNYPDSSYKEDTLDLIHTLNNGG